MRKYQIRSCQNSKMHQSIINVFTQIPEEEPQCLRERDATHADTKQRETSAESEEMH